MASGVDHFKKAIPPFSLLVSPIHLPFLFAVRLRCLTRWLLYHFPFLSFSLI
jgi:hypothetical protein